MTDAKEPIKQLTKSQAAALMHREVVKLDKEGKPVTNRNGDLVMDAKKIGADEVFAFRDHGDHVIVVTTDGQKFRSDK